jgi:hypothetical protein
MPTISEILGSTNPEIKCGSVVVTFFRKAKKHKWFLVIGNSKDGLLCLTVLFNSRKPFPNLPELSKLQYHLDDKKIDFLDHQCYANCAHPEILTMRELQNTVKFHSNNYKGEIPQQKLDEICTMVANAKTVSPKDVTNFGLSKFKMQAE